MSARPESQFPTIADLRDGLSKLVDAGMGDLPVQVLVVPDSTIQAIARQSGGNGLKPALMIQLNYEEGSGRIPVTVISTDRMQGGAMESSATQ
jgi:hypothetical protein